MLIHVLIKSGSEAQEHKRKGNESIQLTYRGSQGLAGEAQKKDDPHPHVVCLPVKHRQNHVSHACQNKDNISVSMPLIVYQGG